MNDISKDEMRERLGNIDQIRDLLFGSKEEEFAGRFNQLESDLTGFKQEMREQLSEIQSSLSEKLQDSVNSLEKKIKYLGLTTHEEINKIIQDSARRERTTTRDIDTLSQDFKLKTDTIREEISQNKEKLQEDIYSFKNQIISKIEAELDALKDIKVSRDDLAEVLFELCIKIKGADFVPDLKEASDNNVQADFLLPEQQ